MKMRFIVWTSRFLFLLTVGLFAPPFPLASGEEAETPPLTVKVDVAPKTVVIGREVTVTFELTLQKGVTPFFPDSPPTGALRLLRHERDVPHVIGSGGVEVHRLVLLPVRLGTLVLGPIEIPYTLEDGEAGIFKTPEVRIQVSGTLSDEPNPTLAPPGDFVEVPVPDPWKIWGLSGLAIAILASVAGALGYRAWRAYKEAHKPPPPPRPPIEIALEKLSKIEAMGLVEGEKFQELALSVSEVFKEFLGATFAFPGLDMTTYEVLWALKDKPLNGVTIPEVEDFLGLCDLIKFAKYKPSSEEAARLIPRAREMVQKIALPKEREVSV